MIYMDNAATSYPKPEAVYEAVDHFNRFMGGNPGRGSSKKALKAGAVLLETREAVARLFNIAGSDQVAFAANVTEAINIGLKGILKPGDHVITTSMEHNAVARPLHVLSQQGVQWTRVKCAGDGSLDPADVRAAIRDNTRMICMLHASNLTGTIMPISDIGAIARDTGALFMVDSAQTAGVLEIDVVAQNIDILAFTGHKGLMGPQGTGGIYLRPGLKVSPLKEGGTGSLSESLEQPELMPDRLESGTLNTPGIAGLLAGLNFIEAVGQQTICEQEQKITAVLIDGLKEIKGLTMYGPGDVKQQTAVAAFNIVDMDCGELAYALDSEFEIVTRSGLHCAPLAHQTIGTLEQGACRISPGYFTTEEEILQAIKAIHAIAKR